MNKVYARLGKMVLICSSVLLFGQISIAKETIDERLVVSCFTADFDEVSNLIDSNANINCRINVDFPSLKQAIKPDFQSLPFSLKEICPVSAVILSKFSKEYDQTPIVHKENAIKILTLLVKKGAELSPEFADPKPLALSLLANEPALALILIDGGAECDGVYTDKFESRYESYLHLAVQWPTLVSKMLNKGAELTIKNSRGYTPLNAARNMKLADTEKVILEYIENTLKDDPSKYFDESLDFRTKKIRRIEEIRRVRDQKLDDLKKGIIPEEPDALKRPAQKPPSI